MANHPGRRTCLGGGVEGGHHRHPGRTTQYQGGINHPVDVHQRGNGHHGSKDQAAGGDQPLQADPGAKLAQHKAGGHRAGAQAGHQQTEPGRTQAELSRGNHGQQGP